MTITPNNIYCGNCFDYFKTMPNDSVDYVFTSPPYNRKRNDKYTYYEDTLVDYYDYLCTLIDESLRVSKKHVFINIQTNYYNSSDVYKIFGKYAEKIQQVIIWEKSNPMPANGKNMTNSFEYFIILGDDALKSNYTYTKNILTTSVNSNMPKNHKAVMKEDVAEWFIQHFTEVNDIVLDPNCGVGTTCVVCKNNNRKYIGFELSEEYYNDTLNNLNII